MPKIPSHLQSLTRFFFPVYFMIGILALLLAGSIIWESGTDKKGQTSTKDKLILPSTPQKKGVASLVKESNRPLRSSSQVSPSPKKALQKRGTSHLRRKKIYGLTGTLAATALLCLMISKWFQKEEEQPSSSNNMTHSTQKNFIPENSLSLENPKMLAASFITYLEEGKERAAKEIIANVVLDKQGCQTFFQQKVIHGDKSTTVASYIAYGGQGVLKHFGASLQTFIEQPEIIESILTLPIKKHSPNNILVSILERDNPSEYLAYLLGGGKFKIYDDQKTREAKQAVWDKIFNMKVKKEQDLLACICMMIEREDVIPKLCITLYRLSHHIFLEKASKYRALIPEENADITSILDIYSLIKEVKESFSSYKNGLKKCSHEGITDGDNQQVSLAQEHQKMLRDMSEGLADCFMEQPEMIKSLLMQPISKEEQTGLLAKIFELDQNGTLIAALFSSFKIGKPDYFADGKKIKVLQAIYDINIGEHTNIWFAALSTHNEHKTVAMLKRLFAVAMHTSVIYPMFKKQDTDNNTLLHIAVNSGKLNIVKAVLEEDFFYINEDAHFIQDLLQIRGKENKKVSQLDAYEEKANGIQHYIEERIKEAKKEAWPKLPPNSFE